jgi:hypothetical protein
MNLASPDTLDVWIIGPISFGQKIRTVEKTVSCPFPA